MNSLKEPLPGWIDNIYGPIGIAIGAGLGIIRTFHGNHDIVAHLVPVDYVCNCILAATWKTAKERKSNVTVFNYIGFKRKQLTWGILFVLYLLMFGRTDKFYFRRVLFLHEFMVLENTLPKLNLVQRFQIQGKTV